MFLPPWEEKVKRTSELCQLFHVIAAISPWKIFFHGIVFDFSRIIPEHTPQACFFEKFPLDVSSRNGDKFQYKVSVILLGMTKSCWFQAHTGLQLQSYKNRPHARQLKFS